MNLIDLMKEKNALLEGHFLLSSGKHSDKYVQCALLLQYPEIASDLGKAIAEKFAVIKIDKVLSPALGGVIIGQETARALGVIGIFAERENNNMTLRRGFSLSAGENVLVVEDVITTGGSAGEVSALVKNSGANLAGVGCIVDRSGGKANFPALFKSIIKLDITAYDADKCPLCKTGSLPIKPGSRKI